jgi:hypothetical protein
MRLTACKSSIKISPGLATNFIPFILSLSANRFLLHLSLRSVRLAAQLDFWCLRS